MFCSSVAWSITWKLPDMNDDHNPPGWECFVLSVACYECQRHLSVRLFANPNRWFGIRISLLFFWRDQERKLIRIFFWNDSIQDWFANQRWFANILLNKNYGFLIRDSWLRNFWFATSSTWLGNNTNVSFCWNQVGVVANQRQWFEVMGPIFTRTRCPPARTK